MKESLFDNIVNSKFSCDAHMVEYTDDSNKNRNDDTNGSITFSNYFRPININEPSRRHPVLPQTTVKTWNQKLTTFFN